MTSDAGSPNFSRANHAAPESSGSFFVGGHYVEMQDGLRMTGQIYVQRRVPQHPTQPYPMVMIHGGGQTGMNFEITPDGRPGWAEYFVGLGFTVYVVDQPSRARSGHIEQLQGPQRLARPTDYIERQFTAPEDFLPWPRAELHTQWPGSGRVGDPIFDQFYASQVSGISDGVRAEQLMRDAGAALLEQIGPSILLTHSQSGPQGWHICDARPDLVKAILAIEPGAPPFVAHLDDLFSTDDSWRDNARERPFGITVNPISYDPPVTQAVNGITPEREPTADGADLVRCILQQEPARRLTNLTKCPVLLVVGEASRAAVHAHCTVKYLMQAGVDVTPFFLGEHGIHGNGHMMMLEMNSDDIAQAMFDWLKEKGIAD